MSDEQITVAAQWCPHNESFHLCGECAKKWMKTTGRGDDE